MLRIWQLTVLCMLLGSGCSHFLGPRQTYQTVQCDPNRHPQKAVRLNQQALQARDHGKEAWAEQLLQKALIADVSYGPAHNNLGELYFSHGEYYLAAWEFEYAKKLMPDTPEPMNNLAMVYEETGRLAEALAEYELAFQLDPQHPEVLANLTRCRIKRGNIDPETAQLLREVVLRDARSEWRIWAEEQLATRFKDLVSDGPVIPHEAPPLEMWDSRHSRPDFSSKVPTGEATLVPPRNESQANDELWPELAP